MQFSKIAVATATSAALALSTITAPAAVADDSEAPRGGHPGGLAHAATAKAS